MTSRREILPRLPIVFGLSEEEAAAAVGISSSKFRELVKSRRMPPPRRIDGRLVFDVDELREAFKAMPHVDETAEVDTWADVV
jgi:predicted DNA-binding transcriptional regulator AlpA